VTVKVDQAGMDLSVGILRRKAFVSFHSGELKSVVDLNTGYQSRRIG